MSAGAIEKPTNGAGTQIAQAPKEVTYQFVPLGESDPITLTVSRVKQFLCTPTRTGKYPDNEQVVKFIMLCKAQGLNPWVNDAYLVGYDSQNGPTFSLITAHQAFLKRAEASKEYDGMESGVIVQRGDGEPVHRPGDLVLRGETLIGGWATVHRKDRTVPSSDSLNLTTFNTDKSRWKADPAGMIVKCAEASALRKAFPSNLAGLYCREEMDRVIMTTATSTTVMPEGTSKAAALTEQLRQRQQQATDEGPHDEPPANGEESQDAPPDREAPSQPGPGSEDTTLEQEIAGKISAAISTASDNDRLIHLEQEAGLIVDDALRIGLYEQSKARREALAAMSGGKPSGKKQGTLT